MIGRVDMGGEVYQAGLTHEVVPGRLVAVHDECELKSIAAHQDEPYRNAGAVRLLTLDQLVTYTQDRFRFGSQQATEDSTCIFVSGDCARVVYNYYQGAGLGLGWGDDSASYFLEFTPEWDVWTRRSGTTMKQSEFCEFIEDNLKDIASPSGADMLQMVSEFRQRTQVEYGSSYRTSDGQQSLTYQETKTGANKEMALPSEMSLHLPVILGAESLTTYEVKARLYVRVDKESHKLIFAYKLMRQDIPEKNAVRDVADALRKALPTCRVYEGKVQAEVAYSLKTL